MNTHTRIDTGRGARGFSLVELLVVMAIIAILASIVVPNAAKFIGQARANRALGEISNINMALTKLLADANKSSLYELFEEQLVLDRARTIEPHSGAVINPNAMTTEDFDALQTVYTRGLYALLREGRAAINTADGNVLSPSVLQKVGSNYLDIGFDPWNNLYQIWPGPWRTMDGPNVFRTYLPETNPNQTLPGAAAAVSGDLLSLEVKDPETEDIIRVGYPAPRDVTAFIYSYGENKISGQAKFVFDGTEIPTGNQNNRSSYRQQEPEFMGGGDDVNSWDKDRSWMRFYN